MTEQERKQLLDIQNEVDNEVMNMPTFTPEMGEYIRKELQRLQHEREEWLKNKKEELP